MRFKDKFILKNNELEGYKLIDTRRHGPRRNWVHAGTGHHRIVPGQEAGGDFGQRGG